MYGFRTLWIWALGLLLTVSSCAYPIKQEYRKEAVNVPFSTIVQSPTAYTGDTVIWGGEIVETANTQNGTDIIVLQIPLDSEGRPKESIKSQGRFIARSPKFLDPEVYKGGKKVTVAGKLVGVETMPLGKIEYTYPVVQIEQLHLWQPEYSAAYYYPNYWGWYGYPPGPWGSPFYPYYWWP